MTNNNIDSDPDFYFPSSSSLPCHRHHHHHQKPRKKRTKNNPLVTVLPSKPKKPDPSAPKITRPCTECGKKFWSIKALFGHMRCHPERQWRGINPPPNYRRPISTIQDSSNIENEAVMTAEDHEVAACLLLLASSDGALETDGVTCSNFQLQEDDHVNCRFECSSCKKVFGSHQALGGHRASHKNVKGCFAINRTTDGDCEMVDQDHPISGGSGGVKEDNTSNNSKMLMVLGHKCSICLRVFSSGQALGGHKRCHWEKGEDTSSSMNQGLLNAFAAAKVDCGGGLDLNLPAPIEDESSSSYFSGLRLDLRLGL